LIHSHIGYLRLITPNTTTSLNDWRIIPLALHSGASAQLPASNGASPIQGTLAMLESLDWFKGKFIGNHGFYHQI
jgi:hypothetical protein